MKKLLCLLVAIGMMVTVSAGVRAESSVREPLFAGKFYPADAERLSALIRGLLQNASSSPDPSVRAIIVPHAGYIYSGQTAAQAYRTVEGGDFENVVVMGFSHRTLIEGIFVDDSEAVGTPLGEIRIDQSLAKKIRDFDPFLRGRPLEALAEHSVEVQFPFIRTVLPDVPVVPIYMGQQSPSNARLLGRAVAHAIRDTKTLIVVSSDLSHFHPDAAARAKDRNLISLVENGRAEELSVLRDRTSGTTATPEACGLGPIMALLTLCGELDWPTPRLLKYSNSSEATGDTSSVVGYAAMAVKVSQAGIAHQPPASLSSEEHTQLVTYVRQVLEAHFRNTPAPQLSMNSPVLLSPRGVFVTLNKEGRLRGCVGRITTDRPVRETLPQMALAAALNDPRFPPVTESELDQLEIHISLLTVPERIDSWKDVRLGTDGLIVRRGAKTGVFLPEVADQTGWNQEEFFLHCATEKAGLRPDELSDAEVETFQTESF
ncbi:MAG: AmmeMemoRadiSam system protein B [Candidatus Omnitrophica bacterium]|nr:AmmeMemoRadiSam system protein B [Candidatus Omnitrophota bacterium]